MTSVPGVSGRSVGRWNCCWLPVGRLAITVRADAEAREVIVLIGWLSRSDDAELDARGPRLLSILVDGLRAQP